MPENKPVTYEQLYGEPEPERPVQEHPADYCPYKEHKCLCWDHGCQAEVCIYA